MSAKKLGFSNLIDKKPESTRKCPKRQRQDLLINSFSIAIIAITLGIILSL